MMDDEIQHDKEKLRRERGLEEDVDVGHQDDEPHMLKSELIRAGKMIQMLYQKIDKYDRMDRETTKTVCGKNPTACYSSYSTDNTQSNNGP